MCERERRASATLILVRVIEVNMARMKCHTSRWNKSGHEITNSQSALECTCAGHERREEREKKVSFGSQVAGAFF